MKTLIVVCFLLSVLFVILFGIDPLSQNGQQIYKPFGLIFILSTVVFSLVEGKGGKK